MAHYDSDQLKRLEPAYLSQYGLNEAPFSIQHDDNFLYLDAERHQRLDTLTHLTTYSNLLLIVSGERGIGKTSLMRRFCQQADESWYLCEVNAHTMMDADTLLSDIAGGFGLNGLPSDPSTVQEIVFEHLKALQNDDLIPILIIDDAHELPKDALETLFYFADIEAAQGHLLRIILFCEPQIDIMLESPSIRPLRERITHTLEINPFNEDQTAEFIKHRMAVAGFEGTSPFTPQVIKKIHKIARGIPSHICELAHLHLDDAASLNNKVLLTDAEDNDEDLFSAEDLGYNDSKPVHTEKQTSKQPDYNQAAFSLRHIVFISIVAIVAISVFVMQDSINEAVTPTDTALDTINRNLPSAIKKSTTPELNKTKEITLKGPPAPPPPELEDEPVLKNQQAQTTPVIDSKLEQQSAIETAAVEHNPDNTTKTNEYLLDKISPNPVTGSKQPQTLTLKGSGFKNGSPAVWVSWTGRTKALKKHQYKIVNDNTIKLHITVGTIPDEWSAQLKQDGYESAPVAFSVIKPKAKPASVTTVAGLKDEHWILDQEPNHFTLQLLGTHNKANIKQFAKTKRLSNKLAVYQTIRNTQPWYVLIYGSYQTKDAAIQSRNSLASKKIKPWLRRFDSVQANINTKKNIQATVRPTSRLKTKQATIVTSQPTGKIADSAAWLWSQDPRHYTLQLLGGRNDKSIQAFIRKYRLRDKAVYFHTRHNQRNWYAVVYGSYSNRGEAIKAIKQLPKDLQQASPWARSFASIHRDLDQSQ